MIFRYLPQPNAFTGLCASFQPSTDLLPRELSHEHHHFWAKPHLQNMAHPQHCLAKTAKSKFTESFHLQETSQHHEVQHPCLHMVSWSRLPCTMSSQAVSIQGQQLFNLFRKLVPVFDHPLNKKMFPCVQMESLTNLCPFSPVTGELLRRAWPLHLHSLLSGAKISPKSFLPQAGKFQLSPVLELLH